MNEMFGSRDCEVLVLIHRLDICCGMHMPYRAVHHCLPATRRLTVVMGQHHIRRLEANPDSNLLDLMMQMPRGNTNLSTEMCV